MASENVNIVIKAVDKTKKTFSAVTTGLNMVKKAVFSLKSGLLALGGIAGMGYLVKQSMNTIDALGKTASKIGIATDELGALRYAAEQTGVASNTLDMALQRMVRRVSEAAMGTGEAVKALKEMNIDAAKLNDLSPDEQFRAIAEAMAGVENQSDKVRLAMRLFDSEGVALVNTLDGGKTALDTFENRARELGMTLSGDLVDGVEEANDAISTFQGFLGGMFKTTVAELAPLIKGITQNMMEWVELKVQEGGGAGKVARGIAISVVNSTKVIVESFGQVANSIIKLGNVAGRVANFLNKWFGEVTTKEAQAEISNLNKDLYALEKQQQAITKAGGKGDYLNQPINALKEQRKEYQNMIDTATTWTEMQPMQPIDVGASTQWLDDLLEKMKGASEAPATDIGNNDVKGLGLSEEQMQAMLERKAEYEDNLELWRVTSANNEKVHMQNIISIAEQQEQEVLEIKRKALQQQLQMQKDYKRQETMTITEAGNTIIGAMAAHNEKAFKINKAIAIKNALIATFEGVSQAMKLPFPANIAMSAVALAKGYANVSSIRATQFREKGGPISAGSPYIVGERGPELIVPNQAANVVPNDQLGGNNVTINVTTNDASGFDDLLTRSRGTLLGLMNQALNENGKAALV